MLSSLKGNKYGKWADVLANCGTTPYPITTTGESLHPVMMVNIEKRIREAIESGDTVEQTRLARFYINSNPKDFIFEPPVKIGSGYKFCYINRKAGFLYPDQVMDEKKYTLRELLSNSGIKVYRPATLDELNDVPDEDSVATLIDMELLGFDTICFAFEGIKLENAFALLGKTGLTGIETLNWADSGFENTEAMGDDEEMFSSLYGFIKVSSPLFEDGAVYLPIASKGTYDWLVSPPKPSSKSFSAIQPRAMYPSYRLMNFDTEIPMVGGPVSEQVEIMFDGKPLPVEERSKLKWEISSTPDIDGSLTAIWSDEGKAQLSYTCYYNQDSYLFKRGQYTNKVLGRVRYTDQEGIEYSAWVSVTYLMITGYNPDYKIVVDYKFEGTLPGTKRIVINRKKGNVSVGFEGAALSVDRETGFQMSIHLSKWNEAGGDSYYTIDIDNVADTSKPIDVYYTDGPVDKFSSLRMFTVIPETGAVEPHPETEEK